MYDVRDIVNKAIDISNQKKALYEKLLDNVWDPGVKITIKVLMKAIDNDMKHYRKIIDNITNEMAEVIDFGIYDKVSSLVNQFSRVIIAPNIQSKGELLAFAIRLEESSYALLVDIQGRMVQNEAVSTTVSYYVLTELIEDKMAFIERLKAFN